MTHEEKRTPSSAGRRWIVILCVGLLFLGLVRLVWTGGGREASERLELGRSDPERIDILGTEKSRYSQGHEEVIVRDFFQDRRAGVFVDIGGAYAMSHSTTFYLEQELGWTGISVDALDEFREGYEKHRPNTKFFNYIVTDHSGTVEDFYRLGQLYFMSTTDKEYAETFGRDEFGRNDYKVIQVTTITIDDLRPRGCTRRIPSWCREGRSLTPPSWPHRRAVFAPVATRGTARCPRARCRPRRHRGQRRGTTRRTDGCAARTV